MGVLTLKSFPFVLRSWNVKSYNSIDPTDAFGQDTRVIDLCPVGSLRRELQKMSMASLRLFSASSEAVEGFKEAATSSILPPCAVLVFGAIVLLFYMLTNSTKLAKHYSDIESLLRHSKEELMGDGSEERFNELFQLVQGFDGHGVDDGQQLAAHLYGRDSVVYRAIARFIRVYERENISTLVDGIDNTAQYDCVVLNEFQIAFCKYYGADSAVVGSIGKCELFMKFLSVTT